MNVFHYIIIGLFGAFAIADHVANARSFPSVAGWRLLGLVSALLYFTIATYSPFLWDEWLGAHRLVDLTATPIWVQIAIGFLVLEAGIYAWHRTMHHFDFLWRWFHQMHHSAERVDIWGAFYFHPFDMIGWALLGSLSLVWAVGLTPEAVLVVAVASTFCTMFQHTNIRTPRWLGCLITRPESHSVHHQRGVHGFNYGDVPWFDMMFGTFRNPERFDGEVGFHEGGSKKIGPMLAARAIV